jgi:hypothetical protein
LTAPKGVGKTWILENLVKELLGNFMIEGNGSTTEAGLRQTLGNDALSIVFDEAEPEGVEGKRRMAKILEMARVASPGSVVIKGSANGTRKQYTVRSSFLFSSISVALSKESDISRTTVIELKKDDGSVERKERFSDLETKTERLLNRDGALDEFRSRIINLLPDIISNQKKLRSEIISITKDTRLGDQLSTLMAGAMAYEYDYSLSDVEIKDWCKKIDWDTFIDSKGDNMSADVKCLNSILQHLIKDDKNNTRSIYSVLQNAKGGNKEAKLALANYGIKYMESGCIRIANKNKNLEKVLSDSDWSLNWGLILKRFQGAIKGKSPDKFNGIQCRYVDIPYEVESIINEVEGF